MAIHYDIRNVSDVDHAGDYLVLKDMRSPDRFTIDNWNEAKLGQKKTIDEYRAISELPQFKAWYKNWYRARKIAHGNTPAQAEAKVRRAFPD